MFRILNALVMTTLCLSTGSFGSSLNDSQPFGIAELPPMDNKCGLVSSQYFPWIAQDGSLNRSHFIPDMLTQGQNEPQTDCDRKWQPLPEFKSCRFCQSTNSLICEGTDAYRIPPVEFLPTTNFNLFKLSGVGLNSLPPQSFAGLSIEHLIIENSKLPSLDVDVFQGVESIKYLHIKYTSLDQLNDADHLFEGINNLAAVELRGNGLKVLSSDKSANLSNLKVFSLAENPIDTLNVEFLRNSRLRILDLRNVTLRIKREDVKSFSSLPSSLVALDLNGARININSFDEMLEALSTINITVLNLANVKSQSNLFVALHHVKRSLKYLNFQGTQLRKSIFLEEREKTLLNSTKFISLEELNMKRCGIESIGDVIRLFPKLRILSLSENPLLTLNLNIISYLPTLNYLDFSANKIYNISNSFDYTADNLLVVDLSLTEINLKPTDLRKVINILRNVQNLSLCDARLTNSHIKELQNLTNLKLLDLSGTLKINYDVISSLTEFFASSNLNLTELHFSRNNFHFSMNNSKIFSHLHSLKVLNLSRNWLRFITPEVVFGSSLESLVMAGNLITTWYNPFFGNQTHLKSMDLSDNQITYVSDAMFGDFYSLKFLNLNFNPIMCDYRVVQAVCETMENQNSSLNNTWLQNRCYDKALDTYRDFHNPKDCHQYFLEVSEAVQNWSLTTSPPNTKSSASKSLTWLYILVGILLVIAVVGFVIYWKWWTIKCYIHHYLSVKKARMLRKSDEVLTRSDIQYDVFVSYSDTDRSWVLDHLVPNLEGDGDVSLCFHERDFQVGLSILENIIECMDRSNCLLLIVSSAFVRSKWCQFEMHLAQYRLIETLRDQLVLVLLEDIPRKTRPQTLHHMMMTKTYLVWPLESSKDDARELFWKRLKRALRPSQGYLFDV